MTKLLYEYDYYGICDEARNLLENRKKLKKSALERYNKYFAEKCKGSARETELAKQVIPGGIQHNLANNFPFQLSIERADGPYLYDIDGNRYIDFLCAGGPTILGNKYPAVNEAAIKHLKEQGPVSGLYSIYERELAEIIIKNYPSVEMFRALASGTEADIIAIRLARAYTNKKHIIRFQGGYHGWSDQLVYNDNGKKNTVKNGIPTDCIQNTHAVPINDIEALERAFQQYENDGGVAGFIMEAIGQDSGIIPTTKEYHIAARKLCDKYGALLIYDEVVTAFRLGMGGAQVMWGVTPDITVFGKIIGGGFGNAGGVGSRKEIMELLAAGISVESENKVKVGGTMTANPLTTLAGVTVLKELEKENVHEQLHKASDYFMKGLADITERYDVPCLLFHNSSILHIDPHGLMYFLHLYKGNEPGYMDMLMETYHRYMEFSMALTAEGLIIANGGKTYMPYGSIGILDDALDVYERVFKEYE